MEVLKPKVRLFYALNGYETLRRVHKIFYDKVYAHPWLGQFFAGHDQQFIENQQTMFMAEKFGGPRNYLGKDPKYAHEHMHIPDNVFEIRQTLLSESLAEVNVPQELVEQWLKIDNAFRKVVTNESLDEFYKLHTFKQRVVIEK
jgi:truncated hemoglobin YjbI